MEILAESSSVSVSTGLIIRISQKWKIKIGNPEILSHPKTKSEIYGSRFGWWLAVVAVVPVAGLLGLYLA